MKRSKLVVSGLLAIGIGVMLAPTASAQDLGSNFGPYQPCSNMYRLPWEPASLTTNVVLSPFGTTDIYCASNHGFTDTYQVDPRGNKHHITMASVNLGSINPPLGFYVWDPATF
ncbi:hypothetical protein [Rhodococcus sp. ACT016]|uniref:hypothetical protein n=1 Tax=Rhodococcus sp. ACT016 TaxID=3134808 RepID=UPI003D2AC6E0